MTQDLADLLRQLSQRHGQEFGRHLDGDEQQTKRAIDAAVPMFMDGLRRNAKRPEGARALADTLEKKHDGTLLDHLGTYAEHPNTDEGQKIVGHVFGSKQDAVASKLSAKSGLSAGSAAKLLAMLAPVLMGVLGKAKKSSGSGAGGLGGILSGLAGNKGCLMAVLPLLGKFLKR